MFELICIRFNTAAWNGLEKLSMPFIITYVENQINVEHEKAWLHGVSQTDPKQTKTVASALWES